MLLHAIINSSSKIPLYSQAKVVITYAHGSGRRAVFSYYGFHGHRYRVGGGDAAGADDRGAAEARQGKNIGL